MFRNANNNFFAFVCNHSATDVNAIAGNVLEASAIANGDVVLVTRDNEILPDSNQTAVAGLKFKIATKAGGKLFYSPLLELSGTTIGSGNNVATTNQVTIVGGTGYLLPGVGTDDTAAAAEIGNSFYVLIEKNDNDEANRQGYAPSITAQVKLSQPTGFSLTNAEEIQVRLAEQLRTAIAKNDQLEASTPAVKGPKYLRAKVVTNVATPTNITGGANTATFVYGSKTVTLSAAAAAGIAAADYLNVAGDLYKIAADPGTGTTITLVEPYSGPSEGITTGTAATEVGYNTQAEVQAAVRIGVSLTGQSQHSFDVNRERNWSASRFNVRFAKDGEGVGAAITTTAANEGLGAWQQVAMEEYESFGALGQRWVSDIPAALRDKNTVEGAVYGLISLREVTTKQNALIGQTIGKATYHIWLELQSGVVDGANSPQDVLLSQLNVPASAVQ